MDCSVVVPFYNAEPTIEKCIRALMAQSYPADRYEILMVDNNSTDRSADIVRNYPAVHYLKEGKQGSYAARNNGIAAAKGTVVAFTDPDCVPRENWLEQIMRAMRVPGTSIVLGDREFAGNTPIVSLLAAYESEMAAAVFSGSDAAPYYGYTNNMAVRKDLLDQLGRFTEIKRGGDNIFVRQAIEQYSCAIVHYAPEVSVRHLEIETAWDYLGKKWTYGKVNRANRRFGPPEALSKSNRLKLFRRALRRGNYGMAECAVFLLLLTAGAICFELGKKV